tara:strand:- start:12 stop:116 length:105 start_codon:yes stop_codon:yes gene_type:complete
MTSLVPGETQAYKYLTDLSKYIVSSAGPYGGLGK